MTFQPDQTVYLPDGREAVYVTEHNGTHLVRVVFHSPGGYDEPPYDYPSDTVTGVQTVYAAPPVEAYDERIKARHATLLELDQQLQAKRQEIADAARNKTAMEKAAAKYPCIQQALDFIEGRITHVVRHGGYGGAEILTLKDAFEQIDRWGGGSRPEGMKLLNLFGTDEHGRNVAWGLNEYRDGSGSTRYTIWPATSEQDARRIVMTMLGDAINVWRGGTDRGADIKATLDKNPWLKAPDDWLKHQAEQDAARKAEKIAKLHAEIEKLEAEE
jgi:hypothetical protein